MAHVGDERLIDWLVGPSDYLDELARKALESLEKRKGENIVEWAARLAEDVCPRATIHDPPDEEEPQP